MAKLLHIEASPKQDQSSSTHLARRFLKVYQTSNPEDEIETLNVFDADLPTFGAEAVHAKFAPIFGEQPTPEQQQIWSGVRARIDHFASFDKIVLSSPMWNYSVPYPLKHYLDIIMQPGITFGYDREKMIHIGLLENRPVQFILTRSSIPPGDYGDFQLPYLRFVFGAMGLNDIRTVTAWQTTKPTADERASYIQSFAAEIEEKAAAF